MIVEQVYVVKTVRENIGVKLCCLHDFDGEEYDI